jgi:transcriptional regulator with GAF, ATPase, and Fis domain
VGNEISFSDIVGKSGALRQVLQQVETVAPHDSTVLILGETGTGKELIARAIHRRSWRRDEPLVWVNCTSIPKELFESEFFGHARALSKIEPVVSRPPQAEPCFWTRLVTSR